MLVKRRPVTPFSLSFLDIMFCGFGAVVLLVLILNTDTVKARNQVFSDLRAEAVRLEEKVLIGEEDLVRKRNSLDSTEQQLVVTQGETEEIIRTIEALEVEIASMAADTTARREHVASLSTDLKQLDEDKQRLGAESGAGKGSRVLAVRGEGDRQYLTGLKVGGQRILILVDASASMLDETIVNVVRRRNGPPDERRAAPKWKRSRAAAAWLISQLPAKAKFQVFSFNTQVSAVAGGSMTRWLSAARPDDIQSVTSGLGKLAPEDGTSLYAAFKAATALSPLPDNILLITDGLPTQGRGKPKSTTVSADQRLSHFEQAVRTLSDDIPVNTILMPMEGDAWAAAAYWRLAVDTNGSFLTPARDWP
jgi:hypothetical protein